METIIKGKIANALTSAAIDHIVATANDIYDENIGKYQSDINKQAIGTHDDLLEKIKKLNNDIKKKSDIGHKHNDTDIEISADIKYKKEVILSKGINENTALKILVTKIYGDIESINIAINKKADRATTLAGYGIIDAVLKEEGKGLSTNDYTTEEKTKLSGIEIGAQKNVQADWNATSGDAVILNKPQGFAEISDNEISTTKTWSSNKINDKLTGVYRLKGSVETIDKLPKTGMEIGDVYNVTSNSKNYVWNGSKWELFGSSSEETDPTVPEWAKQPTKPNYNDSEILISNDIKYKETTVLSKSISTNTALQILVTKIYGDLESIQIALDKKPDRATTLAGYGILDAYTKTEIDTIEEVINDKMIDIENIANYSYNAITDITHTKVINYLEQN